MGLEEEVIKEFLQELSKSGTLKDRAMTELEKMLTSRSVTRGKLMELIKSNATLQNKEGRD